MVQQTQLRLLFKYIEENMDTAVSSYDAKQIKKILGGILLDEPVRIPEPEQTAVNPIAEAYYACKPIRYIDWDTTSWIKKHCEGYSIDERGKVYKNDSIQFSFDESPQQWEIYTEPDQVTDQEPDQVAEPTKQPSSQVKLDNSFDRERFEAMFRAVVETHEATMNALKQLDAYYASKEGGENE